MVLPVVVFPVCPIVKIYLIVNCVLVFLTLVVVILRILSRFVTSAALGWDDYLVLTATTEAVGMLVIQGSNTNMGVGCPNIETLPDIVTSLKLMVSYALIYSFCISTVKISAVLLSAGLCKYTPAPGDQDRDGVCCHMVSDYHSPAAIYLSTIEGKLHSGPQHFPPRIAEIR